MIPTVGGGHHHGDLYNCRTANCQGTRECGMLFIPGYPVGASTGTLGIPTRATVTGYRYPGTRVPGYPHRSSQSEREFLPVPG
eukprot:2162992-Rhodomonas_salina.1